MAYLDNSGLSYFWGKLKTLFDGKVSKSGDTMTKALKVQMIHPESGLNTASYNCLGIFVQNESQNKSLRFEANFDTESGTFPIRYIVNNQGSYGTIQIRDAIKSNEPTTLSQVQTLIANSTPSGIPDDVQTALDGKVSKNGDTLNGYYNLGYTSGFKFKDNANNTRIAISASGGIVLQDTYSISLSTEFNGSILKISTNQNNKLAKIQIADATSINEAATLRQLNEIKPIMETVTLSSSEWTNKTQTVTANYVFANETKQVIQPVPAVASQAAYMEAGVYASGQADGSLTFTCETVPTSNLTVYVLIQNLS